jgi:short-subunit dehydrogenase
MHYKNKTVWITGASSGIGEALALEFASLGAHVIISARRLDQLERVKKRCERYTNKLDIITLDLENPDSIEEAYHEACELTKKIDVLVNNAGLSQRSLTFETPEHIDRRIMEINYFGQIKLTKMVLLHMLKSGGGQIAAVSSITGKFGFPLRSAYSASKHALAGFFESLMLEERKNNIFVSLIFPGRIKTNISLSALEKSGQPHGEMDTGQEQGMPAEKCARIIVRKMQKRKKEILVGKGEIMMIYIKRFFPSLFRKIALSIKPT